MSKIDGTSNDSLSRTLYAKRTDTNSETYPVLVNTDGSLKTTSGFNIPEYDEILLTYTSGNVTQVVYNKASVSVATLTLTYTDGALTGVVKT